MMHNLRVLDSIQALFHELMEYSDLCVNFGDDVIIDLIHSFYVGLEWLWQVIMVACQ